MSKIMPESFSTISQNLYLSGQLLKISRKQRYDYLSQVAAELCRAVPIPLKDVMGALEKEIILGVLDKVAGNQRNAAKVLGLKHTTLNEKLKRHQIRVKKMLIVE